MLFIPNLHLGNNIIGPLVRVPLSPLGALEEVRRRQRHLQVAGAQVIAGRENARGAVAEGREAVVGGREGGGRAAEGEAQGEEDLAVLLALLACDARAEGGLVGVEAEGGVRGGVGDALGEGVRVAAGAEGHDVRDLDRGGLAGVEGGEGRREGQERREGGEELHGGWVLFEYS